MCSHYVSYSELNYIDFYIQPVENDEGLSALWNNLVAVWSINDHGEHFDAHVGG